MNLPPPDHDDVRDLRRGRIGAAVAAVLAFAAALFHVARAPARLPDDDLAGLARAASSDAQDYWSARMPGYRRADVVIYTGGIWSPCGGQRGWQGPAYCPASGAVYLDLAFLREIRGDAARAYVVAHEIGHHVQRVGGSTETGAARELQADCLAGAWMGDAVARGYATDADLGEIEQEAAAVGDDVLGAGSVPVGGGHGTGAQRLVAVAQGARGGPAACGAR